MTSELFGPPLPMSESVKARIAAGLLPDESDRAPTRLGAEILPFPICRRGSFIARQFDTVAKFSLKRGDAHFRSIIGQHRARLARYGVSPDRIEAECEALRSKLFDPQV